MITIIVAQWENDCMLICKFCFALHKNNKLSLLNYQYFKVRVRRNQKGLERAQIMKDEALSSIITGHRGLLFFEELNGILCVYSVMCAQTLDLLF